MATFTVRRGVNSRRGDTGKIKCRGCKAETESRAHIDRRVSDCLTQGVVSEKWSEDYCLAYSNPVHLLFAPKQMSLS